MCLAIPMKVIEVSGVEGKVEISGVRKSVDLSMTPDVRAGAWVLIHAGFAISELDEEEAQKSLALFAELTQHMAAAESRGGGRL